MLDALVFSAVIFGVAFFAAWLALPNLRARIERPKYTFQANVKNYDQGLRTKPEPSHRKAS